MRQALIENVTYGNEPNILLGPSQFVTDEDVRQHCFGCDRPLTWVDEMNPRCECGCLLYFPIPTSEHI